MNLASIEWATIVGWLLLPLVFFLGFRQFAALLAKGVARLERRYGKPVEPPEDRHAISPAGGQVHRFGRARTPIDPDGRVEIQGETWSAVAETTIDAGAHVEVVGAEGLVLRVRHRSRADGG